MNALREAVSFMYALGARIVAGGGFAELLKLKSTEFDIATTMWHLFSVFGVGMILIHYLLDLNQTVANSGSNFTMQLFTFPTIKFCMACMIIQNGAEITSGVVSYGNVIIDKFDDANDPLELYDADIASDWSIFACLLGMLIGLIYWLVCIIIKFMFMFKVIGYKIEVIFRVGLAPLFMGDIADGFHSGAFRYWKRVFGTVLYGASFIAVVAIGTMLQPTIGDNWLFPADASGGDFLADIMEAIEYGVGAIVISVAELGVLGSIKQVCMEIGQ